MTTVLREDAVTGLVSALIGMDRVTIREILDEAIEDTTPGEVIDYLVVPALEEIGQNWEEGNLALSQVYMAGTLIEEAIDLLIPDPAGLPGRDTRIATVVLDDYHMLGERIVSSVLKSAGYTPVRYGHQDVAGLLPLLARDGIQILLISVLMFPSALKVREVTSFLAGTGTRVIVGGAPFRIDPGLGAEVGADRVCVTASDVIPAIHDLEGFR